MGLRFAKMHGLGNDFVLLDARATPLHLDAARIRAMADRHTGIGFDQLLILEPPRNPSCVAAYAVRNADGSAAEQCGNGARCIGAWLHREGALAADSEARLDSPAGIIGVRLIEPTIVAIEMGEPEFDPPRIPFDAPAAAATYPLNVADQRLTIGAVSMGNPHAVLQVDGLGDPRIALLGPEITRHPRFPHGANAGFVEIVDAGSIRLRVHERGAGWTLACGSGACAAVAVLHRQRLVRDQVRVALPGGTLQIEWPGPGRSLWMTGPATFVFDGEWWGRLNAGRRRSAPGRIDTKKRDRAKP